MTTQNNNTLFAGQQHDTAQNHTPKGRKSLFTKSLIAKVLGSATAGMAVGVGAAYASGYFNDNADVEPQSAEQENLEKIRQQQELQQQQEEERQLIEQQEQHPEEQEQQPEEQEQQPEEQEQHDLEQHRQSAEQDNQQQQPMPQRASQEEPAPQEVANFMKDHEVKIEGVSEVELEDGRTVQVFHGTVDGHPANFLADDNGQVVAAALDLNGNGEVDENEVVDLRGEQITAQNLMVFQVTSYEPEITVVEVRNDVETEKGTVDVALVSLNGDEMYLIDTDHDGEVNLMATDVNGNKQVDEGEVRDISDTHITMPERDDINGNHMVQSDDGMLDYSNDADTTVYEA
ncbi:hypothetical protein MR642_00850 [bacterium]|nr:hypothetical protein [bacterium]